MAGNVAASMTASIIIDKKEIVSSALAAYADAQKELDGNKLELLIDVSDDKAIEKVRALQKELGSKEYIIKFNNQGLEETLKSIDELGNKLKDLISGKLTGNGKGIGNSLVDEQQLKTIIDLFEKMESHLGSMRKVFSDVGDGEEFSPLLQTIKNVESAVKSLDTTFKGIGFNMNIDVGPNSELENQLQSKVSNALSAYERLFEHIKMSNAGDDTLINNFFGFDINQFDTTMAKVQAYRTFIENQRKDYKARHDYPGATDAYADTDKKYWNQVSSAMGEITKVQNKIKASGDTSALDGLFGKTDLTEVISGLNQIVVKLDEIIASANELKTTFSSGLKIDGATSEIADLTNRVKELEDELSKLKVGNGSSSDSSSSSKTKRGTKKSADSQLNDDWESATKLNNALNVTAQRYEDLGKSSQALAQTDGYKKLQDDLQKFNNELTSGSISLDRYNSKVDSAFNKLDQRMEKNRETVKKFTDSSVSKLSDAITKYSYGDTTDATALMNKLSGGVTNFKDLTNISGELEKFKSQVKEVIDTLKQSHAANLKGLNDDIAKEAKDGAKAYNELNDAISRYCALKIKEAKGKALPGDLDELNALDTKIKSIMETKGNGLLNNEQIDSSQKRLDELNQSLEYLVKNLAAAKEKSTASSFAKDLAAYETEVSKAQEKLTARSQKPADGHQSSRYKENLEEMRAAVDEMDTLRKRMATSMEQGISPSPEDTKRFSDLKTKVQGCEQAFKGMSAAEKGASDMSRDKLFNKIGDYLQKNSGMAKEFKVQLQALQKELSMRGADANVADLTDKFLKLQIQIREAGQEGRSFFDVLKDKAWYGAIGQIATYFSFNDIIRYGQQGVQTVRELNAALTEMRKVSDEPLQALKAYQKQSFNTANAIATTGLQMQNSIADWQRLGYSISEANELAKNSNIYKNVGDMDISTATEHMVSSVQAWKSEFNDDAVKTSEEIMNRYNKIGNEFAISSGEIGEAMETSAAALKAGGNDLNEALGLITAGNIIQQDASTTSSAMKILSLRIRGAKSDLESMGESTDDLADSTSKLREEIKGLTGVDIMADEETFKSTAEIIKEIGAVWDRMTDVSQAATLEKLAGKNRASTVAGLIENYKTIDDVIQAAANADNSALDENQKIIESIDGRIQQLQNRIQEFWYNLIDDSTVGNAVSVLTSLVEGATKLVDTFGLLPPILTAIGAVLSTQNVGRDKMYSLAV